MGDARFDAGTIEEYRERPIEFAYRTGLNHGNADGRPRLFTRESRRPSSQSTSRS